MIGTATANAGDFVTVENYRDEHVEIFFEGEDRRHVLNPGETLSFVARSVGSVLFWLPLETVPTGANYTTVLIDLDVPRLKPPVPIVTEWQTALRERYPEGSALVSPTAVVLRIEAPGGTFAEFEDVLAARSKDTT